MLDKSVSYHRIYMKLNKEDLIRLPASSLPDGYSFRLYQPGDIKNWVKTETSVLEFTSLSDGIDYFKRDYLPHEKDLVNRMVFVVNAEGEPVGNATAWRNVPKKLATLDWVAVRPDYQGLGLGKAIVLKTLSLFPDVEPGRDVYLQTQTWSHLAVRLYFNLGFRICKTTSFPGRPNDWEKAKDVLAKLYAPDVFDAMLKSAI